MQPRRFCPRLEELKPRTTPSVTLSGLYNTGADSNAHPLDSGRVDTH